MAKSNIYEIVVLVLFFTLIMSGCLQEQKTTELVSTISESSSTIQTTLTTSSTTTSSTTTTIYTRQNITFFRGIWPAPGHEEYILENDAEKLKKLGVNIIGIDILYRINGDNTVSIVPLGPRWEYSPREGYLYLIRSTHQQGFAVLLEPNTMIPWENLQPEDKDEFMENFLKVSERWAEIAEKEHVELYSPLNEPNMILGDEKSKEWARLVLPKVREKYSGDILLKFADLGPEDNFSGYDYVSFDVYWSDTNFDELRTHLSEVKRRAREYKRNFNLKGVIFGEMGAQVEEEEGWGEQSPIVGEDDQAKIMDIMFNETWGRLDGYFVSWGRRGPFSIEGRPAESIVEGWYTKQE